MPDTTVHSAQHWRLDEHTPERRRYIDRLLDELRHATDSTDELSWREAAIEHMARLRGGISPDDSRFFAMCFLAPGGTSNWRSFDGFRELQTAFADVMDAIGWVACDLLDEVEDDETYRRRANLTKARKRLSTALTAFERNARPALTPPKRDLL